MHLRRRAALGRKSADSTIEGRLEWSDASPKTAASGDQCLVASDGLKVCSPSHKDVLTVWTAIFKVCRRLRAIYLNSLCGHNDA